MEKIIRKEIEILKNDMQELLIHVDSFTRHNREVTQRERLEQIRDLETWVRLRERLNVLEDVLNTYLINCDNIHKF